MVDINTFRCNGKAYEDGVWVDDIPWLPEVRLKVRTPHNVHSARLQRELFGNEPVALPAGNLDPERVDEIDLEVLSRTVLLDWDGLDDDEGNPLPFSIEKAKTILGDPDFTLIRNAVRWASEHSLDLRYMEA